MFSAKKSLIYAAHTQMTKFSNIIIVNLLSIEKQKYNVKTTEISRSPRWRVLSPKATINPFLKKKN